MRAGRAVALVSLLLAGPSAAATEEAPVFRITLTVHRGDRGESTLPPDFLRLELAGATSALKEDVLLSVSVDADPELRPSRASLRARYAWTRSLTHDTSAGLAREERGVESGQRLLDWDLELQRSFRPIACEEAWVYDRDAAERAADERVAVASPGRGGPDRSELESSRAAQLRRRDEARRNAFAGLRLRARATWAGRVRLSDRLAGIPPFEQETLPSLEVDRVFAYALEDPAPHKVSFATETSATGITPPISSQWDVEVSLTPLEPFEHSASAGTGPDGALLLQARVVAGGRDLSPRVSVARLLRLWAVPDLPGTPAPLLVRDWHEPADRTRSSGWRLPPGDLPPAAGGPLEDGRWLVEVLERVDGLPELGLLYQQVTLERRVGEARPRVTGSGHGTVSAREWCVLRGGHAPAPMPPMAPGPPAAPAPRPGGEAPGDGKALRAR
jgi:hypothetical protein